MENHDELAVARARGRARRATAALRGDVGLLCTLAGEHAEIASFMEQAEAAGIDGMRRLYPLIRGALCAHVKAEELELYDVLIAYAATRSLAEDGRSEHEEILALVAVLDRTELGGSAWLGSARALRARFAGHVDTEEELVFPLAREILGERRLRDLDKIYRLRRDQIEREIAAFEPTGCLP